MNHRYLNYILIITSILFFTACHTTSYEAENFGAKADGVTDNTKAIQQAIDECHKKGGGIVRLTNGLYLSGTIHLKSNVTLNIASGSTLKALPDAEVFPLIQGSIPSRMDKVPWKAFIRAEAQQNISITGGGTLDGSGDDVTFTDGRAESANRPYGILFINCQKVIVENLFMKSSGFWMQRYFHCTNVRISGLNVFNHANLNNDGLDIDSSEDVIINDCIIDSSDDAIAIKSESERPSKNITISNCILSSHASAIKLGTGSIGGFQNISISNIIIRKSKATTIHHPLKLENGMTGIDLASVDGGVLKNVNISNVVMEDVENPIHIRLGNRMSRDVGGEVKSESAKENVDTKKSSILEDVCISNVNAINVGPYPVVITGYENNPVKRVQLRNINIQASRGGTKEDLTAEINWEPHWYPFILIYNSRMPAYGIVTNYTEDLLLENFKAVPAKGDPRPMSLHLNNK